MHCRARLAAALASGMTSCAEHRPNTEREPVEPDPDVSKVESRIDLDGGLVVPASPVPSTHGVRIGVVGDFTDSPPDPVRRTSRPRSGKKD